MEFPIRINMLKYTKEGMEEEETDMPSFGEEEYYGEEEDSTCPSCKCRPPSPQD
jgi:hypothetical protein